MDKPFPSDESKRSKSRVLSSVGTALTVAYYFLYMMYGKDETPLGCVLRIAPAIFFLLSGLFFVMESISPDQAFPSREWSVEEGGNSYISVFGYRKYFGTAHVVASGVMSMRTARIVYALVGTTFVVGGALWILHQLGVLPLAHNPDIAG